MQELVDNEPELEEFEGFYLKAFWQLITERRGGHVIPHSEIREYGSQNGLDSDMIGTLVDVIWGLERAHSDWLNGERDRIKRMNQKND